MEASSASVDAVWGRAPYSARVYMHCTDGRVNLDAQQFEMMRYCGGKHFIFDVQIPEERPTGAGGWSRK